MLLAFGSRDPYVAQVQRLLQVPETGVYDEDTIGAVTNWQAQLGVAADGIWGPQTQQATDNFFSWLGTQGGATAPATNSVIAPVAATPALGRGTADQNSAIALMQNWLKSFGLDAISGDLWKYIVDNGIEDSNSLMLWIYDRPEFKERFPAFEALQKVNRAITPQEYINLERSYSDVMHAAGLPSKFFDDPKDFTNLISNNVSPNEFADRIQKGYQRVASADPLVREQFYKYFGHEGDDALAAYFIDPKKSSNALIREATMAEMGAAARQTGIDLNVIQAENLANRQVSYSEALQGMERLQSLRPLFSAGVDEAQIVSSQGSTGNNETNLGIDYVFGTGETGTRSVRQELQRRLEQRKAETSGERTTIVTDRQGRTSLR